MEYTNIRLEITAKKDGRVSIGNAEYEGIADVWERACGGDDLYIGNARRLVAAWNACDGLETELLETLPLNFKAHALQCADLRAQNAALLAAVKEMHLMLPVLEYLQISRLWETANEGEIASLVNYRATLEKALEAIKSNNQ